MNDTAEKDPLDSSEESEKLAILLVDDEADILKSLTRVLRFDYDVVSFTSGAEALAYLDQDQPPIIISDMRMPEMDGAEFLRLARERSPDSIRFLLTGYSDMESTVRAVNEGGIHTYLSKPWDNQLLKETIAKAVELFQLKREKRELTAALAVKNVELEELNQNLEEKVKERTEMLELANKKLQALLNNRTQTFKDILATLSAIIQRATGNNNEHSLRIAEISRAIAKKLHLSDSEISHIYLAGLLHEIGLIRSVEEEPVEINLEQSEEQNKELPHLPHCNPVVGAELISQIKRFQPLVEIIRHQDEHFDGTGTPDHLQANAIPVGARILKIVKSYDFLVANMRNPHRMKTKSARLFIKSQAGEMFDPDIADLFIKFAEKQMADIDIDRCVSLEELKVGSVLKEDLYLPNGKLMLTAGSKITYHILEKLKEIEKETHLPLAIFI